MPVRIELVVDAHATLGEGPFWDVARHVLYWVDIFEYKLHIYAPGTNADRAIQLDQYVGAVVPRQRGGVMLALHHGFAGLDLETEKITILADPEAQRPQIRFNDGKCDPAGRFWAGTMALDLAPGMGRLYCLDTDHVVRCMLDNLSISNGINWSLDHKVMYFIDTPTRAIAAFDYDLATGSLANRREVIQVPEEMGLPDGMTIDSEGMLWVGLWGEALVGRWDPSTGRLLQTIELPTRHVTACAFGGPNLDHLYITTARLGLDDRALAGQPHAGGLFRAIPGVRGVALPGFAG